LYSLRPSHPQQAYYSSRRGSAPGCIDIRKNDLATNKSAALFLLRNSKKSIAAAASLTAAYRRSSFPAVKYKPAIVMAANYSSAATAAAAAALAAEKYRVGTGLDDEQAGPEGPGNGGGGAGRKDFDASLIYNTSVGCKVRAKLFEGLANYRNAAFFHHHGSAGHHHHHHHHHHHGHHHHHHHPLHHPLHQAEFESHLLAKKKKSGGCSGQPNSRRRGSVPQDLFIRSLNNYAAIK